MEDGLNPAPDPFMDGPQPSALVEAALFAASGALTDEHLASLLPQGVLLEDVHASLSAFYDRRGIRLARQAGTCALVADLAWTRDAPPPMGPAYKPTDAALQVLVVIALHQPVTVPDIEAIRGTRLNRQLLASLLDSGLVKAASRRDGGGRAVTYATTDHFLERYVLGSLAELPTAEEISALFPDDSLSRASYGVDPERLVG
jgi:segregation and condensation protein B